MGVKSMFYEKIDSPKILVFAGPNGSGKSTTTKKIRPIGLYINADDLKKKYGFSDLQAAQTAEKLRSRLIEESKNFTFETVLSTERNIKLLAHAKEKGYYIHVIFILTKSSAVNVKRVDARVAKGGHPVPKDKIISRYKRSLQNISALTHIVDRLTIIDNTGDLPVCICEIIDGTAIVNESQYWTKKEIFNLIAGIDIPD